MRKEQNVNVRLDRELKRRAEAVAEGCGSSLSMVIRLLLERFVQNAEKQGGKVVMPPEFKAYDIRERMKP